MQLLPDQERQVPKSGNRPDECEDYCVVAYPMRLGYGGKDAARLALSDGASESAFARSWAQILAEAFVHPPPGLEGPETAGWEAWLSSCQGKWNDLVPWARIPWHGEAKTKAGALATLLGLTFYRKPGDSHALYWQAVAVGDSCLFWIRQDELLRSFPLDNVAQFGNAPALLCSNPANNAPLDELVHEAQGECQSGDVAILASDALAGWFLARHAAGDKPWQTLTSIDARQWEPWVQAQREANAMRNDDTTLAIARVR